MAGGLGYILMYITKKYTTYQVLLVEVGNY